MTDEQASIKCPGYQAQESICARLAERINAARTVSEKASAALELINAVQELLDCDEYAAGSIDCQCCRGVSVLRKEAAELVLKMGTISQQFGSPGM